MLNQSAFLFLLASSTNKVGDTCFPCSGNFALGHGGESSHFDSIAPSCRTHQNLDGPWRTASKILGVSESDLPRVTSESVWRSGLLDHLASGQVTVASLDDRNIQVEGNPEPTKSREAQLEEIIFSEDLIIQNAPAVPQVASLSTREVVRNGLSLSAENTKSLPSIGRWIGQSDAQIRVGLSFEITSTEAQTALFGVQRELDTIASRPVSRGDIFDLLASGRVLALTPHDQQCPPQHGAKSKKSAKVQPQEINLGEVQIIKSATEKFKCDRLSTQKSTDDSCHNFKFGGYWRRQGQWPDALSATKYSAGQTVLPVRHSKNSTSKRIPKAIGSTPGVVRSGVSVPPTNTNREPGVGKLVDQSDTRAHAKQPFDFTLIEALPVQFGVIDGLDAMAPETNLRQHFTECRADFESSTPLLIRLTRSDSPLLSPAKSRSYDPESVKSDTRNADGYPTNRSLGWLDHQANHWQLGNFDELPRAKFLADATTISVPSRAKAGCQAHLQQTQTPTRTTP